MSPRTTRSDMRVSYEIITLCDCQEDSCLGFPFPPIHEVAIDDFFTIGKTCQVVPPARVKHDLDLIRSKSISSMQLFQCDVADIIWIDASLVEHSFENQFILFQPDAADSKQGQNHVRQAEGE